MICFDPKKIEYSSSMLDKYCHIENVICIWYSIDYATTSVNTDSNLFPVQIEKFSFNPDMCVEHSNFSHVSAELEKEFHDLKQKMQSINNSYKSCTFFLWVESIIETVVGNILMSSDYSKIDMQEKFSHRVETECSYGNNEQYLIDVKQDDISQLMGSVHPAITDS